MKQTNEVNHGAWFLASLLVAPVLGLIVACFAGPIGGGVAAVTAFAHMNGFKW
ncbi:hypothetical protein ACAX43_12460 [Paraburkholderia sp. IW21]|uniref:hypothetical protein n=1 Tax=Paraburkholderia sp. IW21 TaxID=3242488 RepID=UPI003520F592